MARIVVLDAGPLGLASNDPRKPEAARCLAWLQGLADGGTLVVVPEIADYEIRRELLRSGATAGVRRLNRLLDGLDYRPITTEVMRRAADYWAQARRAGLATADPKALDGDVILAGQASLLGVQGDEVIIATTNPGHLGRFADARPWDQVGPGPIGGGPNPPIPPAGGILTIKHGPATVDDATVSRARVAPVFDEIHGIPPVILVELFTSGHRAMSELLMALGWAEDLAGRIIAAVEQARAGTDPGTQGRP